MSKTTILKRETEKAVEDTLAGLDLHEAKSVDALFEELGIGQTQEGECYDPA